MDNISDKTKRLFFASLIVTTMGIVLRVTLENSALGVVGIAVGGLLLIAAFAQKRKETE